MDEAVCVCGGGEGYDRTVETDAGNAWHGTTRRDIQCICMPKDAETIGCEGAVCLGGVRGSRGRARCRLRLAGQGDTTLSAAKYCLCVQGGRHVYAPRQAPCAATPSVGPAGPRQRGLKRLHRHRWERDRAPGARRSTPSRAWGRQQGRLAAMRGSARDP